jgi:hypothetical protein
MNEDYYVYKLNVCATTLIFALMLNLIYSNIYIISVGSCFRKIQLNHFNILNSLARGP